MLNIGADNRSTPTGGVQYQLRAPSECQICTSCCSDVDFDLCLSAYFAERFVAGGRSRADGVPGVTHLGDGGKLGYGLKI